MNGMVNHTCSCMASSRSLSIPMLDGWMLVTSLNHVVLH